MPIGNFSGLHEIAEGIRKHGAAMQNLEMQRGTLSAATDEIQRGRSSLAILLEKRGFKDEAAAIPVGRLSAARAARASQLILSTIKADLDNGLKIRDLERLVGLSGFTRSTEQNYWPGPPSLFGSRPSVESAVVSAPTLGKNLK